MDAGLYMRILVSVSYFCSGHFSVTVPRSSLPVPSGLGLHAPTGIFKSPPACARSPANFAPRGAHRAVSTQAPPAWSSTDTSARPCESLQHPGCWLSKRPARPDLTSKRP